MPSEVTSNDRFYVVSKNIYSPLMDPSRLADPILEAGDWSLKVKGLVERPMTLSYEDLRALPAVEQYYTLCCISNEIGGSLIGNALWKGVPLKAVLDLAGVKPGVRKVVLRCADKYFESITLEKASDDSNLIAWEMNGETLPIEHGFPARLLIPNLYGIKNVKWLTEIEANRRRVPRVLAASRMERGGGHTDDVTYHRAESIQRNGGGRHRGRAESRSPAAGA